MSVRHVLIGVEGHSDRALVEKALSLMGMATFKGTFDDVDAFWRAVQPPRSAEHTTHHRPLTPTIMGDEEASVAVVPGQGDDLLNQFPRLAKTYRGKPLTSLALIVDADDRGPQRAAQSCAQALRPVFPAFPAEPGTIIGGSPRMGVYVLPDNSRHGKMEHLLIDCAEVAFAHELGCARRFVDCVEQANSDGVERSLDRTKALVATVGAALSPGTTTAANIYRNPWITKDTAGVPALASLIGFLDQLIAP